MALFPISIFGPISYYQKLASFEKIELEIYDTFQKQSFRNRYQIGTSNGVLDLTIPISKPNGSKTLTKDIQISNQEKNWRNNHWRALTSAYMHSPYFEHYEDDIKKIFFSNEEKLIQFSIESLLFFKKTFGISTEFNFTSDFSTPNQDLDFRFIDFFNFQSNTKRYIQPFETKFSFQSNLSILDLLFCEGPTGRFFLL